MPEIKTSAELTAAFARGDKLVRRSISTGIERLLNFTASKAQRNVRQKKKAAEAVGAGASLVNSIGTGPMGVRHIVETTPYVIGRVGTKLPYGAYLEFGTGIYGPKRKRITSKTPGKPLAWEVGTGTVLVPGVSASGRATKHRQRTSNWVYAMSVKGVPPWNWLSRALEEMRPRTLGVLKKAGTEVGL